ncbi:MAG TPA: hypothetical protein VMF08_11080 [Candidatus Sulfotelmatobacter sp.]|nr:hypothetical protein [Candidatus Sulfotelmatobacter sp.]
MKVLKLKVKEGKRQSQLRARRIRIRFQFALLAGCLGAAVSASAQSYSIDWHKIAGGGGLSTGGSYQINGTIGQPEASGTMSGGNYSMTGGFWSLISAVQTPGAPPLYISIAGNTVTVYWQNVSGYTLKARTCCAGSTGWTTCPWSPITSNGTNYVNITGPTGSMFFTLCKQ